MTMIIKQRNEETVKKMINIKCEKIYIQRKYETRTLRIQYRILVEKETLKQETKKTKDEH